jgi:hypothetical protein
MAREHRGRDRDKGVTMCYGHRVRHGAKVRDRGASYYNRNKINISK